MAKAMTLGAKILLVCFHTHRMDIFDLWGDFHSLGNIGGLIILECLTDEDKKSLSLGKLDESILFLERVAQLFDTKTSLVASDFLHLGKFDESILFLERVKLLF